LHLPFEKRVEIKGQAEERRAAEPDLKVGTVDLNADSAAAAAWEGARCRGLRTVWHHCYCSRGTRANSGRADRGN